MSRASVQVMSTLSPTLTFDSASLSWTFELYAQPLGPLNEIDGTFMSMADISAVIVRCLAAVTPGFDDVLRVRAASAESFGALPAFCTFRTRFS
jgi:hypothetical protein